MEKNSILIVDDEAMNITALSQMLKYDYTIYVEKDGQGCIDTAMELKPDLILLDIIMPAMSGFEVIDVLKKKPETKDIPVIFVTGLSNSQDEEKGFVLGAADYIGKPFSSATVKLRVRNQIQIVNQQRMIESLITTDSLTGLYNQRSFRSELEREWKRAIRQQTPVSFILFNIDNFNAYDEAYGHSQGDVVLKEVAHIIKSNLFRAMDIIARWDGAEFAVILPDTVLPGACIVAEKIRSAIEKHLFVVEEKEDEKTPTNVTVSVGLHCAIPERQGSYTDKDLITSANKALSYAKGKGRNRVCAFTDITQ